MDGTAEVGVVLYWRPGCLFCFALRRRLRGTRVPMREIDIWAEESAAARVRAITGGDETVPTVVVGRVAMVNPTAAEVLDAVRAHAPHLLASGGEECRPAESPRGPRGWVARLWRGGAAGRR